jgi:hypothetical protein
MRNSEQWQHSKGFCSAPRTFSLIARNLVVSESESESESYITTDSQSASLSWNKAPIWGLWSDIYLSLTITALFFVGVLSDERAGLTFVYAAGTRQRSLSWVRVPLDS